MFTERLRELGLGTIEIIPPLYFFDVTYWDCATFPSDEEVERQEQIHEAMFPNVASEWADFAVASGISADDTDHPLCWKWRNRLCDRLIFTAHEKFDREILVTSNLKDFGLLVGHPLFPNAKVMRPAEAVELLHG